MKIRVRLVLLAAVASVIGLTTSLANTPTVEAAPATFVVNSTNDGGDNNNSDGICQTSTTGECTLRAAVEQANTNGNPSDQDIIEFGISGTGPHTINQVGLYYFVSQPLKIDGYTQLGSSQNTNPWPNPLNGSLAIEIDSSLGAGGLATFVVGTSDFSVSGLAMTGSPGNTILVETGNDNVVVTGNYLGVDSSGLVADYSNGAAILAFGVDGLRVGGSSPEERNVIAGYGQSLTSEGDNIIIKGNYIGVGSDGVTSMTTDPGEFTPSISIAGDNVSIGGTSPGEGNTFEGNINACNLSIAVTNSSVLGNRFSGNYCGIAVAPSDNLSIGDGTEEGRNVISGNDLFNNFGSGQYGSGIELAGSSGSVSVRGNYIGVAEDGVTPFGNGRHGVSIRSSQNLIIGGTSPGDANIIANNAYDGISLVDSSTTSSIMGNSIFDNGQLGINLLATGDDEYDGTPTLNDQLDGDSGPNNLLNTPVLSEPGINGSDTDITYQLDVPAGDYRVEFFSNTSYDASGFGEGKNYIGSDTVTSLGAGGQLFTATIIGNTHTNISATVTALDVSTPTGFGATSEFSGVATNNIDTAVTKTIVDQNTIISDGTISYEVTITNNGFNTMDLSDYVVDSGDPLNTALFNDIFPSNLTLVSAADDIDCSTQNSTGTFDPLFSEHTGNVASCSFTGPSTLLAMGESTTFTLTFSLTDRTDNVFSNYILSVPPSTDSNYLDYQSAISSGEDLIDTFGTSTDNLVVATTTKPQTDVSIEKSLLNPEDSAQEATMNYQISYSNNGPDPLGLSEFSTVYASLPLFYDYMPADLEPADHLIDGPLPGSKWLDVNNSDLSCLWAGPGSMGTMLGETGKFASYSFTACWFTGSAAVLESGDSISADFNITVSGSSDLTFVNYAYASPPFITNDPDSEVLGDVVGLGDLLSLGVSVNNFAFVQLPQDMSVSASLVNPEQISLSNPNVYYDVTITNSGTNGIDLAHYLSIQNSHLLGGLYAGESISFVEAEDPSVSCSNFGPSSASYLGASAENHSNYTLFACAYDPDLTYILSPNESFTVRLKFILTEQSDFNFYVYNGAAPSDPDIPVLIAAVFGAQSDTFDSIQNNNFARVMYTSSGSSSSSSSSGNLELSSTGQNYLLILLPSLGLLIASIFVFSKKIITS